jgi:hypothetical protein
MKFEFLFEDVMSNMDMDEARIASDVKFDAFAKSAGQEIAAACDVTVNRIFNMPGLRSFKEYISDQRDVDVNDPVSIILNVERFYESWINQLDKKVSNDIYVKTRTWLNSYKEKGKAGRPAGVGNKPKDNANKSVQGLDYTPDTTTEPEMTPDMPIEPGTPVVPKVRGGARAGAGRPKLPPEQRKVYTPTGKPKGRPRQRELTMGEVMAQMNAMKAEIDALKSQLDQRRGAFDDNAEPQITELNESLQFLRKQYMRFI